MNIDEGFNRLSFFAVYFGALLFIILWVNSVFRNPILEFFFSLSITIFSVFFIQCLKWIINGFKKEAK